MQLAESPGRIFTSKRVQIEFNEGRVSHFNEKHYKFAKTKSRQAPPGLSWAPSGFMEKKQSLTLLLNMCSYLVVLLLLGVSPMKIRIQQKS